MSSTMESKSLMNWISKQIAITKVANILMEKSIRKLSL